MKKETIKGLMLHDSSRVMLAHISQFEDMKIGRWSPSIMNYFTLNRGPWIFVQHLN